MQGGQEALLPFNVFKPGSIHDESVREFWLGTLKASQWVECFLRDGYTIPFKSLPPRYEEKNNKTARDNPQVVREQLREMIEKGIVKVVSQKPWCVNPLGVVTKIQENGQPKHRLVWDGSRHVNTFLEEQHVRLAHLDKALEMTLPMDYQVVFDLASAYYHIKINPSQTKFLGACFLNEQNEEVYVEYLVLPFGLASAVHCITKIFKPITAFVASKGVRMSIFIDDGRVLATSPSEAEELRIFVYNVITKAGWAIAVDKSDGENQAATVKKYLGFKIDTGLMKVFSQDSKLKKIGDEILEALQRCSLSPKKLAAVLGKITSTEPSHAMLARITTRASYESLAAHVDQFGWKGEVYISPGMKEELAFYLSNMDKMNGAPVKTAATAVRLETILRNPVSTMVALPNHAPAELVLVSDSSDFKAFAYTLEDGDRTELELCFSESQKKMSSTARELLALFYTLCNWKSTGFRAPTSIYWATDSQAAVACVLKGSRKPETQEWAFKIALLASELGTQIIPVHLRREDPRIQKADEGSKGLNTDNWSIDAFSFDQLNQVYNFDFDVFASFGNAKVPRFCSLFYHESAQAVEAFSLSWSQLGMLWVCPPVSLLIQVYHKICSSVCKGVLVLPMWKTASFYSFFFEGDIPRPPFALIKQWHPYIIQNEGARNTPLFGITPFMFAALYFKVEI
jgi:hypothetical protein